MNRQGAGTAEDPEVTDAFTQEPGESMVDLLRGGAAITKVENETLAQIAVTRPRDPKRSLERAIGELELDPEFAEKQYYRIPYKDRASGQTTWIEGLSIKAAMALGRCFGNMTTSSRVVEDNDHAVIVEGVCIDLENGFRVCKPVAISKYYRAKKTGKMVKWSEDRFPQILQAGASKAVRNAILNVIPEPLQRRYWNRARELAAEHASGGKGKGIDYAKTIPAVLKAFEPYKVERSHLEAHLGHPLENATRQEFGDLKAVLNALEAGETDVFQAFGIGGPQPDEPGSNDGPAPAGAPEGEVKDLFGGGAS
jgi:hypothetical protein